MTVVAPAFYYRLPAWCQDLAVTGLGAVHRWRRTDLGEERRFRRFLQQSERWSADEHAAWQQRELRRLLEFACREVPHWRRLQAQLGVAPADLAVPDAWRHLPLLDKARIKADPAAFRARASAGRAPIRLATSGTTGSPLAVYYTRRAFARKWACVARLREWHGVVHPHLPRRVQVTGSPLFDPRRERKRPWRWNRAARTMIVPVNAITERQAAPLLEGMRRWRGVEVLDGYPSALAYLARLGRDQGIPGPPIPLVIATAERLEPAQRELLAGYFQARVVDQYAASEPSVFAGECEQGALHVFPQSGLCEFLPLPGEDPTREHLARIVMTPFHNEAQVLLRYAIGDLARVRPGRRCECGRRTPIVESIEGRAADVLTVVTPQGARALTSALLSTGFYGFAAVRRGQIVQTGPAALTIRYELDRPLGEDGRHALLASFARVCGPDVALALEEVDAIAPGPHGKFRFLVPPVPGDPAP